MKKSTILTCVSGQFNQLNPAENELLKKDIANYEASNKFTSGEDLAKGINNDLPYLSILHDAAVRNYLEKIAKNTSVIKVILVIYFICSIICGIVVLSNYGKG